MEERERKDAELTYALEAWAFGSELSLLLDAAESAAAASEGCGAMAADSLVVHMRALAEYLVGRLHDNGKRGRGRPDDLTAWRYLPAWTPQPTADVDEVDALVAIADKHLAHLTEARTADVAHWVVVDVVDPLIRIAHAFSTALADSGCQMARFVRPYVAFAVERWKSLRPIADVPVPATNFTSRPFVIPDGEEPSGEGKWAARLGPFCGAGLEPLWPDWQPPMDDRAAGDGSDTEFRETGDQP